MIATENKLSQIHGDLLRLLEHGRELGPAGNLFKGHWGTLFYMFYYEQFIDDSQDIAVPLLEELYNQLEAGPYSNYSFCNGLSGPFWLLQHLNKHEFIELDIDDISADFISAAIASSKIYLFQKNFDFLHGSAGICNLLVEFAHRADVRQHLGEFVRALDEFSIMTPQGRSIPMFFYHTDPPSETGTDAFSLAHGTCALQLILLKICKAGIAPELCRKLIYETMEFVLRHENKGMADTMFALFPSSLSLDGSPSPSSRISWCYGDVNVAYALWYCGKHFGEQQWTNKAVEIMYHSAKRNTFETGNVVDACICHGAGGNAAIFQRFWHETNDKVFYNCAEDWYKLAHDFISFSQDKSKYGIMTWQGKDDQWQYCWDILDGSAGTGLALISRQMAQPLPWDSFLLLSE